MLAIGIREAIVAPFSIRTGFRAGSVQVSFRTGATQYLSQPGSLLNLLNLGQDVNFAVTATSGATTNLQYQWKRNGVLIPNATSSTLAIPQAQANDCGAFSVQISDGIDSIESVPTRVIPSFLDQLLGSVLSLLNLGSGQIRSSNVGTAPRCPGCLQSLLEKGAGASRRTRVDAAVGRAGDRCRSSRWCRSTRPRHRPAPSADRGRPACSGRPAGARRVPRCRPSWCVRSRPAERGSGTMRPHHRSAGGADVRARCLEVTAHSTQVRWAVWTPRPGKAKGQVMDLAFDAVVPVERTRTFMGSPPADFESAAYTIPPHRQAARECNRGRQGFHRGRAGRGASRRHRPRDGYTAAA